MSSRISIDQTSRNVICSVVFVDLVEYSKKSVAEQLALKDRFTALLADALKDIAINDRIILDTGDGAAMSFLGDPEDALFVGMSLRDALKGTAGGTDDAPIRIGVNLGPVRLVRDINGHPNIVGDGINVAQRIMSFAQPGQILASRSYYDVVSCLSDEYAKLFSFEGSRTDKHVREHEVYVVGVSESAFKHARKGLEHRAAQTHPRLRAQPAAGEESKARALLRRIPVEAIRQATAEFLRDRKRVTIAGAVLGALVVLLAGLLAVKKPAAPKDEVAAVAPATPVAAPAATAPPALQPAKPAAAAEKAAAPRPAEPAPARATKRAAAAEKAEPQPTPTKSSPAKPEAPPGLVRLSITPWGEVFVDGKSRGVSPPMKRMKLAPGKYQVEVRNTTFAPRVVAIEVKSREEVTVRHVFK